MGLDASTFSSTLVSFAEPPTVAKNRMAYFAETVLPAPDSPLTMMDWFLSSLPDGHEATQSEGFILTTWAQTIHTESTGGAAATKNVNI